MKKQLKKTLNITVRAITYAAIILLFIFSCAVELETLGAIICGSCCAWLALIGLLYWLQYKYGI